MRDGRKRVRVVTMGCSKNRVDSEHLLMQLSAAGYDVSPEEEPLEEADVDILIINTCGFILDAKEESVQAVLEAVDAKKRGVIKEVYVMGCLSQRYASELPAEIPEVDGFFGAFSIKPLLERLSVRYDASLETRRYLTTPGHYAYLKISEGCDRRCSYCAIPGIRGPHVSVPEEKLVDETRSLADSGVKELIVIAQDTTFYGLDRYRQRRLGHLLAQLNDISGIEWIRLLYAYPDAFPQDVLEIMASSSKMCKYLDIPLQHSADPVLKAMRRSVNGRQTRELVEKFRKAVPGIALRTTLMVGHPGEGDKEFDDLLSFVRDYKFERMGAFAYSEEEGTWGAQNLKDSVPESVKQERLDELMEVQAGISLRYNESRIGTVERVLVDSCSPVDGTFTGRTSKESPEVDGEVSVICRGGVPEPGSFVDVRITGADEYDLNGTML
ncbi:MAG TPA: 30S ribosomal protein S12 methylthiotransferase RimO [Candidatus Coprenecus stercoravium]|uniref:Ribosomal protein uS12 methylthiotransferase RimO n=1 Tax=Candidatus Coprenecus stercoravium TaxID=2840735 RepID=A0A9D2GQD9_9BACT|nr:30S ribosomal protein S12 methylthiotransferase RimO [Candidatus Coprenecus stercoravium]